MIISQTTAIDDLERIVKRRLYAMPKMRQIRQMEVIQRYHRILAATMGDDAARHIVFGKWLAKHAGTSATKGL